MGGAGLGVCKCRGQKLTMGVLLEQAPFDSLRQGFSVNKSSLRVQLLGLAFMQVVGI